MCGLSNGNIHQDSCQLERDTLVVILTFLIIMIGVKVFIIDLLFSQSFLNDTICMVPCGKIPKHTSPQEVTWSTFLMFPIIMIGVGVVDMAILKRYHVWDFMWKIPPRLLSPLKGQVVDIVDPPDHPGYSKGGWNSYNELMLPQWL